MNKKVKKILSKEYNLNMNYIVCLHNLNLNNKIEKSHGKIHCRKSKSF